VTFLFLFFWLKKKNVASLSLINADMLEVSSTVLLIFQLAAYFGCGNLFFEGNVILVILGEAAVLLTFQLIASFGCENLFLEGCSTC
jgi:hypothetical protein